MFVQPIDQLAELSPYQQRWDELAGDCVFRSWAWLTTWWKHYQPGRTFQVLLVFADPPPEISCTTNSNCHTHRQSPETLVGILPTYLETTHTQGKVLRLLSDGEVCSEHLDLLCGSTDLNEVSEALADYLTSHAHDWDTLSLSAVAHDRNLTTLLNSLATGGCDVIRQPGVNCWSIALPASWEEFLAMQSKSHRKQLRQMKSRVLDSPRVRWFPINNLEQFDIAWESLIDLHQRRRESLGEPGCFASPVWANFHRDVAQQLMSTGQLRLSLLELDNEPIAAEYHLAGSNATYAYQGGIDPDRCEDEPGQLSMILCVERAIAEGHQRFELLRGDEPYKAHWRAGPTATINAEVISPRALARWRHYSWNGLRQAGRLVRQFTNLLG